MFRRFQSNSNLMRRVKYLCLIGILIVTAACQSGSADDPNDPKVHARKLIKESGRDPAKITITNVVSGDKKYRQADELWCVATDLTSPDGQVPYLLAVWRKAGKWEGAELTEGYYEWDLHGCPR
jgi:hypothetical protein